VLGDVEGEDTAARVGEDNTDEEHAQARGGTVGKSMETSLICGFLAAPTAPAAQPPGNVPRIGALTLALAPSTLGHRPVRLRA
jgi:hypothetical protein